jgi:RNA polymerase sigma factor (sigma-70 family)
LNTQFDTEEDRLVQRCTTGDPEARRQLYERYVRAMYHTVVRMVPSRMDAEDVVQDCFIKVFQNIGSFKGESTIGAWIKRIAINTALNFLRKRKRMVFTEDDPRDEGQAVLPEDDDYNRADVQRIHHAIKKLPEGCRVVLNLYLLEGYKHKEIAQILGISESTSKSQYLRAKRLLRERLEN